MKKFFIVIIMFMIILSGFQVNKNFSLLNYFEGEYTVYTLNNKNNGVNLGFCRMNSVPQTESVVGESIVVENLEVSTAIDVLNAMVVKTEYLEEGLTVIYAFSNLIKENVEVSGHKVNLQIAIRDENIVIGWPLILGSY